MDYFVAGAGGVGHRWEPLLGITPQKGFSTTYGIGAITRSRVGPRVSAVCSAFCKVCTASQSAAMPCWTSFELIAPGTNLAVQPVLDPHTVQPRQRFYRQIAFWICCLDSGHRANSARSASLYVMSSIVCLTASGLHLANSLEQRCTGSGTGSDNCFMSGPQKRAKSPRGSY